MWELIEQSSINGGPPSLLTSAHVVLRRQFCGNCNKCMKIAVGYPHIGTPNLLLKHGDKKTWTYNHHLFLPHILMGDFSIKTHSAPSRSIRPIDANMEEHGNINDPFKTSAETSTTSPLAYPIIPLGSDQPISGFKGGLFVVGQETGWFRLGPNSWLNDFQWLRMFKTPKTSWIHLDWVIT